VKAASSQSCHEEARLSAHTTRPRISGSGYPIGRPSTAATETGRPKRDPADRLAYSVDEVARLTGLSRDLLYAEMRRGHLTSVKVGWRGLIKNGARVLGHDEIEQLKNEVLGWKQLERDALWRKSL
jgi:excisionase family DNA binding protein